MCGTTGFEHAQALLLRLAHGEAADGEARQIQLRQGLERGQPQVGVHAALHDAEQSRPAGSSLGSNARGCAQPSASSAPSRRAPRLRSPGYGVQSSNAMAMSERSARCTSIESSGVSRTSEPSSGERKRTPSSVILRSLRRLNTWKPPESVRIGLLPVHEAMQPAVRGDDLRSGPQHQMERVAEDDLRAEALRAPRASSPSRCRTCRRA